MAKQVQIDLHLQSALDLTRTPWPKNLKKSNVQKKESKQEQLELAHCRLEEPPKGGGVGAVI